MKHTAICLRCGGYQVYENGEWWCYHCDPKGPIQEEREMHETDEELIDRIASTKAAISEAQKSLYEMEREMMDRLAERDALEALHPTHICRIKLGTPTYDNAKLGALRELLPPDVVETAYTPPTTKPVPEKWNGAKLNSFEKRYGGDVAAVIQDARVPGRATLEVKPKEECNGRG
jgi:hypothetical protein